MHGHLWALRNNRHANIRLQRAFNKYGINSFNIEILCECSPDVRFDVEQAALDKYVGLEMCYNLAVDSQSPGIQIFTDERRKKMSLANKGKKRTEETKQRMRKPKSERHKQNMAAAARKKYERHKATYSVAMSMKTRHKISETRKSKQYDSYKGERNASAKLNEETIKIIRERYENGEKSWKKLGAEYNIHPNSIGRIVKRTRWKHI